MSTFRELFDKLPAERRARIEALAKELEAMELAYARPEREKRCRIRTNRSQTLCIAVCETCGRKWSEPTEAAARFALESLCEELPKPRKMSKPFQEVIALLSPEDQAEIKRLAAAEIAKIKAQYPDGLPEER